MSLDHALSLVKHQSPPRDAFLDGRLSISQPEKGFRAGLDSVLLGAAVGADDGALLDLGAGAGVAALVALRHHDRLVATLVETDPQMLAFARDNIAVNGLAEQAAALALDLTAAGAVRAAAGLKTDHFAAVIANPPFFAEGRGTAPGNGGRAAARHMQATALDRWVKTAAASAAPAGEVIFIHAVESLGALLAAFESRFGAIVVLPLAPRPGADATRVLVRGIKGSRAPLRLLPERPLHGAEGHGFVPEFDAILRGRARLIW
jgi:tRNA1(Val) A37 N6-methylase TrmN6